MNETQGKRIQLATNSQPLSMIPIQLKGYPQKDPEMI
uniref:Uncharacterized protein n=1 Tax=Tetranychus urticae TaxID=32264 RepID=T1K667_TETUR